MLQPVNKLEMDNLWPFDAKLWAHTQSNMHKSLIYYQTDKMHLEFHADFNVFWSQTITLCKVIIDWNLNISLSSPITSWKM